MAAGFFYFKSLISCAGCDNPARFRSVVSLSAGADESGTVGRSVAGACGAGAAGFFKFRSFLLALFLKLSCNFLVIYYILFAIRHLL